MKNNTIYFPNAIEINRKRNLADYTKLELDRFRALCNFTDEEAEYVNLRSNGKSNVSITLSMSISESKLHEIRRKVESKIDRVLMAV